MKKEDIFIRILSDMIIRNEMINNIDSVAFVAARAEKAIESIRASEATLPHKSW